jgi:hypothetical protein
LERDFGIGNNGRCCVNEKLKVYLNNNLLIDDINELFTRISATLSKGLFNDFFTHA